MFRRGAVRRAGFTASLATGLTLLAFSLTGMATLDDQLRSAAEQRPGYERVSIELRDCDRWPGTSERPA